jgi:hypothetical protein
MEGRAGGTVTSSPPPVHVAPLRGSRRRVVTGALLAAVPVLLLMALWGVVSSGSGSDSYAFLRTTPRGDPVTWDHCTAIRYQVNPDGAPDNWRELVDGAFDEIAEHSGFVFLDAGETANRTLAGTYRPGNTRGEPIPTWTTAVSS